VSLIQTFDGQESLSLKGNSASIAFNRIKHLHKKLKYIKNTRFFKEISRRSAPLKTVHPTNILLKDRLYSYCYKFYRSLLAYSDKQTLLKDFRTYHYVLLLRSLKARGFELERDKRGKVRRRLGEIVLPKISFFNDTFEITVEPYAEIGLKVAVKNRFIKSSKARTALHLLMFEPGGSEEDLKKAREDTKNNFQTIEAVYFWNLVYVDEEIKVSFRNPLSEQALMDKWLESKLLHSEASLKIYKTFCPSCKQQALEANSHTHYCCRICSSVFAFYHDNNAKTNIWFLKLRREK
jgi:hypothetical protein